MKELLPLPEWMSILNITPDSFSDGGKLCDLHVLAEVIEASIQAGATWLDVGAESTRPGAQGLTEAEELRRLEGMWPTLVAVKQRFPQLKVSLDSRKPDVAEIVLGWGGVDCINDVSGGRYANGAMFNVVAQWQCQYILMHSRGTPVTMETHNQYTNVVEQVVQELQIQIKLAIESGIPRHLIMIDVGFGFAKNKADGIVLLKHLDVIKKKLGGLPLVLGVSRKRMTLPPWPLEASRREAPTAALHLWALTQLPPGTVNIIRTHDVPQQKAAYLHWMELQH